MRHQVGRCMLAMTGALFATAVVPASSVAAEPLHLEFVTHASFFSQETKQATPLDPQVFVRDPNAAQGLGPQGINHVKDFRTLLLGDPAETKLYSATGEPLGFTAGKWLAASGRVTITPDSKGGAEVTAMLEGLKAGGVYSLFENHFDTKPISFTPLDGVGTRNSFTAKRDGSATVTVHAPEVPTGVNAVLLVYHSDGKPHGESRGEVGVTAHHQLIAKVP